MKTEARQGEGNYFGNKREPQDTNSPQGGSINQTSALCAFSIPVKQVFRNSYYSVTLFGLDLYFETVGRILDHNYLKTCSFVYPLRTGDVEGDIYFFLYI